MKNVLLDSWMTTGDSKDELLKALKELTDRTKVIPTKTDNIDIFTVTGMANPETLQGYRHGADGTVVSKIDMSAVTENLKNETLNSSFRCLLLGLERHEFLTTKKVLVTLSQRAGSSMGKAAQKTSIKVRFFLDAFYNAYMKECPADCQVLYREVEGVKKIFSVFTDRYKLIPQYKVIGDLLSEFQKEFGNAEVRRYYIDNFETDILVEFPKKAEEFSRVYNLPEEVVPGVHIHVSDTGESSFVFCGSTRVGKKRITYIPGADFARAHTKGADITEIMTEINQTVFSEFTKMPERLMELITIDLKDPRDYVPKLVKHCEIRKNFGKDAEKEIAEKISASINPTIQYTAYDLVQLFLDEGADREAAYKNHESIDKVRKCFSKAVFYKF